MDRCAPTHTHIQSDLVVPPDIKHFLADGSSASNSFGYLVIPDRKRGVISAGIIKPRSHK